MNKTIIETGSFESAVSYLFIKYMCIKNSIIQSILYVSFNKTFYMRLSGINYYSTHKYCTV